MAPITIKKAIGAVKDQTSISLAKVAGNVAPDLEILVVKATTHDNEAADDKYAREILNLMAHSRGYVNACVFAVSKRLTKTSDWVVALKALVLVHKLLNEGGPVFRQEMLFSSNRGARVLYMAGFRDDALSTSWDQSAFVRAYASYLDQKLEIAPYGRKKLSVGDESGRDEDGFKVNRRAKSYDDLNDSRKERKGVMWLKDLSPERVLERLNQLLLLLERFLASRPTGAAKNTRMVLVALNLLVKDSFRLYEDICDVLKYLVGCFLDLEYACSVKAFDTCVSAAKMIEDLSEFYDWVKGIRSLRSLEYPQVEKISSKLLRSLERMLREKANRPKSLKEGKEEENSSVTRKHEREEEEQQQSMNGTKALQSPENDQNTSSLPHPPHQPQNEQKEEEDLLNLKNDGVTVDEEADKLALSLFSEWMDIPEGNNKASSAWENPAAERGRADWEVVLVESAINLSKQEVEFGGGFDPLLLDGMYDHGTANQYTSASEMSGGSASSVALHGTMSRNSTTQLLALPAPVMREQDDPFAASLSVPPPSYVQMADVERKQQLLAQEQQLWQLYTSKGMQGQLALAASGQQGGG